MSNLKIAIAGAGLMGSLLAWQLQDLGYSIDLFEKKTLCHRQQAASVAAGMLSPYAELPVSNNAVFQLGQRSLKLWPDILAALDISETYLTNGSLVLSLNAHDELHHYVKKVLHLQPGAAIKHYPGRSLEPDINHTAYFFPDEASLDAEKCMQILAIKLQQSQRVSIFEHSEVKAVENGQLFLSNKCLKYDYVIDARGTGASSNFTDLRAVRGELIEVVAPEVMLQRPIRVLDNKKMIYIVPRAHQHYIIGASEIDSADESPVSVRSCVELLALANAVHSGFAEARIVALKTACRPALKDNLPAIQYDEKMIAVNGLYRHGYLLAPALAEKILQFFIQLNRKIAL